MTTSTDILKLVRAVRQLPPQTVNEREFEYGHLSQCVLSAIFSIGANAESERRVVQRYTEWADLSPVYRPSYTVYLPTNQQEPLDWFIQHVDEVGINTFTNQVLNNRQRTSTIGGMLKSEAAYLFARVLVFHGVLYFQDRHKVVADAHFERTIKQIKGQGSGLSLNYFYMLIGEPQYAKADRHVTNFMQQVLGRKLAPTTIYELLYAVSRQLNLTPREVDVMIWTYMRSQGKER